VNILCIYVFPKIKCNISTIQIFLNKIVLGIVVGTIIIVELALFFKYLLSILNWNYKFINKITLIYNNLLINWLYK